MLVFCQHLFERDSEISNPIPLDCSYPHISNAALTRSYQPEAFLKKGDIAIYDKCDGSGFMAGFVCPKGLHTFIMLQTRIIDSRRCVYLVNYSPVYEKLSREVYDFLRARYGWEHDFDDYCGTLVTKNN